MKYFRARFLIAILCLIPASVVFAASEHYEKLYRESADFRAAEDALNDIWKKLKTELKGDDWKKLLTNQRDWLKKQAKMLETGADVNLYLAEACARALRLRDYHQSLMKDGEISGRIVEHKGGAALRTSQRLGAAECSHLYPLYPPVKIEEVSREARAGKNWTPALMNFYADNVVLAVEDFREPETTAKSSATEIAAKAAEDEKKTKAALAEATDEKKEVPARTQATAETENAETNPAAARIAETTPAKSADIAPEESDGTKIAENNANPEKSQVAAQKRDEERTLAKKTDSRETPVAETVPEKPERPALVAAIKVPPVRPSPENASLRVKKSGEYREFYASAAKGEYLITGYELDDGATKSLEQKSGRSYRPRLLRPGTTVYLFSLPIDQKISRVALTTADGAIGWSFDAAATGDAKDKK